MGDAESRCDEWFDRRCVCGDAEFFQCPLDEPEMGGTDDRLMVRSHVAEGTTVAHDLSAPGRVGDDGLKPEFVEEVVDAL